jgi:putative Ca2+/H+ antiporter (TMEM165/GDT1 family)
MFAEYIKALLLIFVAEMGDKTQILAMLFSMKYKVSKVLIGVFIGSLLNHGIAVAFGKYIGGFIPTYILQMIAGFAVIGFALWTVLEKADDEETSIENGSKKDGLKKSAIITVALAFFIGELGDKTQLTAITLSVDSVYPLLILMGTVSGMVLTSGLGIFVGSKLGSKISDTFLKIISVGVFTIFGAIKLLTATPTKWVNGISILAFTIMILILIVLLTRKIILWRTVTTETRFQKTSQNVYDYYNKISHSVDDLCKGIAHCGECQGTHCAVGYMKNLVKTFVDTGIIHNDMALQTQIVYIKDKFDRGKLIHILDITARSLDEHFDVQINYVREIVEMLLLDQKLEWPDSLDEYKERIGQLDISIKEKLTL